MDKTAKGILTIAIAIFFPVFIYFAVVTFIPVPKPATTTAPFPPTAPNCATTQVYNSLTRQYQTVTDPACSQKQAAYQRDNAAYQEALKSYQSEQSRQVEAATKRDLLRWQVALVLALLGMMAILAVRQVKELLVGLAAGAAIAIFGAVGLITSRSIEGRPDMLSQGLILVGFLALTGVLKVIEKVIPETLRFDETPTPPPAAGAPAPVATVAAPEPAEEAASKPQPASQPAAAPAKASDTTETPDARS